MDNEPISRFEALLKRECAWGDEVYEEVEDAVEALGPSWASARGKERVDVSAVEKSTDLVGTPLIRITGYLTRWEALRAVSVRKKWKLRRLLSSVRTSYTDGFRGSVDRGLSGRDKLLAYEERKCKYEVDNIVALKKLEILERVEDELNNVYTYLDKRIRWLEGLRVDARRSVDDFKYTSKKDYLDNA